MFRGEAPVVPGSASGVDRRAGGAWNGCGGRPAALPEPAAEAGGTCGIAPQPARYPPRASDSVAPAEAAHPDAGNTHCSAIGQLATRSLPVLLRTGSPLLIRLLRRRPLRGRGVAAWAPTPPQRAEGQASPSTDHRGSLRTPASGRAGVEHPVSTPNRSGGELGGGVPFGVVGSPLRRAHRGDTLPHTSRNADGSRARRGAIRSAIGSEQGRSPPRQAKSTPPVTRDATSAANCTL